MDVTTVDPIVAFCSRWGKKHDVLTIKHQTELTQLISQRLTGVSITTIDISSMFISCSDEELEDNKALLYLPIAPEVEDPEENPFGPPPDASGQAANTDDASAGGDKKQRQPSSDGGPAKKKARTTTIELQGVPSDGE